MNRPSSVGRSAVTPERIAFAAVVALAVVVLASGPTLGSPRPTPSAAPPASFGLSSPTATAGSTLLAGAIDFDVQLLDLQASLRREVAAQPPDASALLALLRQVDATVHTASQVATRLEAAAATRDVGTRLSTAYQQVLAATLVGLRAQPADAVALRTAATKVIDACTPLVALTADLRALAGASPSPSGSAQSAPSGFANELQDPGFEQAVGGPWTLHLAPGAWATLTSDPAIKVAGAASARVDIGTPSTSWAGIAVQQSGLAISAGGRYAISIALRASDARDLRIRLVSQAGDSYATRLVTIGPTWSTTTFEFIALAPDSAAILEVDLGRASPSVWLDNAAFGPVPATAGP